MLSVLEDKKCVGAACIFLKPANKCLQSQPCALGTSPAGQSHGQVETGPMVASLDRVGGPQVLAAAVCLDVPGTDQRKDVPALTSWLCEHILETGGKSGSMHRD